MTANTLINVLLGFGIGGYALAGSLFVGRRERAGRVVFFVAWFANAAIVAVNWMASGQPPFGSMYHVLVLVALCFLPAYLVLGVKEKLGWTHAYFAFTSLVPLLGPVFMERSLDWRRPPALQSAWFVPHVMSYMFSYSLAAVAFLLTVIGLVRGRASSDGPGRPVAEHHRAAYQTMRLAFPFMTFGLLSGAMWADAAWGGYWSWDPKETWSLVTWTLYIVYFHCRLRAPLRPYAAWAHVAAFLALLTTFLLVNLLPKLASALHSYA